MFDTTETREAIKNALLTATAVQAYNTTNEPGIDLLIAATASRLIDLALALESLVIEYEALAANSAYTPKVKHATKRNAGAESIPDNKSADTGAIENSEQTT